jgi:hypothetical protein
MIGVLSKANQAASVEEFFQLFKTPWECFCPGRSYDVLVVTQDEIPETDAKLVFAYGAIAKRTDAACGITSRVLSGPVVLKDRDLPIPIYGGLAIFNDTESGTIYLKGECGVVGVACESSGHTLVRIGYDLFDELTYLLSAGQPAEYAHIPTLDMHIRLLREWIVQAGLALLEIPPVPNGRSFTVCLTHDIDFVGIRNHKFDHTMWGFLYRSTMGAFVRFFSGKIRLRILLRAWQAAASLPLVYLGLRKDFWEPFQWYLEVEKGLGTTYFFIPFKGRAGLRVTGPHAARRAAAYDVSGLSHSISALGASGCEVAVHGIDAWHSISRGREERARIEHVSGVSCAGVRIHWLLQDENTASVLEKGGYGYDSSIGYNETIGFRAGTCQVFQPLNVQRLLELPVNIQDGALFYPDRMDLSPSEAEARCRALIQTANEFGGVLTVIWHDRSHAPERFWGEFYIKLIRELQTSNPWFATAAQAVNWSRKRRQARFESLSDGSGIRVELQAKDQQPLPPLTLRLYHATKEADTQLHPSALPFTDIAWDGRTMEFDQTLQPSPEACIGSAV